MGKLFGLIITAIWWLWIVAASIGVAVIAGFALTHFIFDDYYLELATLFSIIGGVMGVIWAERVRKRIGLDKFFGAITGAPTKDQSMRRENY